MLHLRGPRALVTALVAALLCAGSLGLGPSDPAPAPACKTWRVVGTPLLKGVALTDVSGTSSSDVWAVGSYDYAPSTPVTLHWDGTSWTEIPSAPVNGDLIAVAAISVDEAWASGYLYNGGITKTLIEHWDGVTWTSFPVPSPGHLDRLNALTAISADDVWALGDDTAGDGAVHGLALHWDGVAWTQVPIEESPNGEVFYGASGSSTSDVWAVGYQGGAGLGAYDPLIEHWDGSTWSQVPFGPPPRGTINELFEVTTIDASDAWAVGIYATPTLDWPLIEHWDGIAWSVVRPPQLKGGRALYGVSSTSAGDVWAVGAWVNASQSQARQLTMHWDGSNWTVEPAPSGGQAGGAAVTSISSTDVWGVGSYFDQAEGDSVPFAEHSDGPCPFG